MIDSWHGKLPLEWNLSSLEECVRNWNPRNFLWVGVYMIIRSRV
jgi:hypothetical protein